MILMSAELMATIICTAVTITTLASTILYSNKTLRTLGEGQKNTQKIIEEGNKNTQKILKGHDDILKGHDKILKENRKLSIRHENFLRGIAQTTYKIADLTEKTALLSVVDFALHGIKIAENVESKEDAKRLGELIIYNPHLKIAFYRPKRSVA